AVFEHLADGLVVFDPESGQAWWNPASLRLHGLDPWVNPDLATMRQMFEMADLDGSVLGPEQRPISRICRGEILHDLELIVRRRDSGWERIFCYSGALMHLPAGKAAFMHVYDITARKRDEAVVRRHEAELERLNRLYRTLLVTKRVITRMPGPHSLFIRVCQCLVDEGGFSLAWVGWHEESERRLVPLASAGDDDGYTRLVTVYTDERPEGRGPAGIAFREGRTCVSNDLLDDPRTLLWHAPMAARGYRSAASFPIRARGTVRGILSAYAKETDFFRQEEIVLMEDVVAEVSQALDRIEVRDALERTRALAEREQGLSDGMIDSMPGTVYLFNTQGRLLRWNRTFVSASGYDDGKVATMHPLDFFRPEDRGRVLEAMQRVFESGESSLEADLLTAAGQAVPYYFTGRRVDFDGEPCVVGVGIDVTQRRQAEATAQEYSRQLQAAARRLLQVQEGERRGLARELHDAVGQELTALSLNLTIIGAALPPEVGSPVRARLEDSMELLEGTARNLRNVLVSLRPPGLDELGLLAALRDHARLAAQRAGLALDLEGVEPQPRLPPEAAMALFRIAQEALNNTVKHANAVRSTLRLQQSGGRVTLLIADDGQGFDTARRPGAGAYGMGTTTMRERAAAMGATLRIRSSPGEGTRVEVELPWPAKVQEG
ncbi:MAG TPA: PAS domain-containing protein, partial [Steroidobacteraceae bacterium]|nr:PAS domain-containing protein [Steroidobacteraceae bacterium]